MSEGELVREDGWFAARPHPSLRRVRGDRGVNDEGLCHFDNGMTVTPPWNVAQRIIRGNDVGPLVRLAQLSKRTNLGP